MTDVCIIYYYNYAHTMWTFLSRGGGQLDANGAPWVIELKRLLGHTLSGH